MGFISQTLTPHGEGYLSQLTPCQQYLIWRSMHTKFKYICLDFFLVHNFVWYLLWGKAPKSNDISSKCRLFLHIFLRVSSEHIYHAGFFPQLDGPFSHAEMLNGNVKPRIKKENNRSIAESGGEILELRRAVTSPEAGQSLRWHALTRPARAVQRLWCHLGPPSSAGAWSLVFYYKSFVFSQKLVAKGKGEGLKRFLCIALLSRPAVSAISLHWKNMSEPSVLNTVYHTVYSMTPRGRG